MHRSRPGGDGVLSIKREKTMKYPLPTRGFFRAMDRASKDDLSDIEKNMN